MSMEGMRRRSAFAGNASPNASPPSKPRAGAWRSIRHSLGNPAAEVEVPRRAGGRRKWTYLELDEIERMADRVAIVDGGRLLAFGTPARDGFLFAIGVTVALVPEGLLPTVTLSLAMGAQRMAKRQGLVRRLDAVEQERELERVERLQPVAERGPLSAG